MLTSISPIDGRYYRQVRDLSSYYSEFALIRYRVRVEIEYFIALCELPLPQLKDFDRSLFDLRPQPLRHSARHLPRHDRGRGRRGQGDREDHQP